MDNKAYRLGMYEKSMPKELSWQEKLTICKESGFDWLEISIDETDDKLARLDWSQEERDTIKQAIIKTGIPIHTMCLSGHRKYPFGDLDAKIEERSLEIMEKAIYLAQDLGIRIIQLAGYDVYYKEGSVETKKQFIKNLHIATKMAAKYGIVMGFETMETPFMDTVEKAMEYVNIIDSPYLQIYPDIGNLTNAEKIYGVSVIDDIQKGKGHIVAAHLKETVPGKYREIPFGSGHTEFVQDIRCLKDMGVCMFTGEFWYTGQENWNDICKHAGSFLREKLDQVFEQGA